MGAKEFDYYVFIDYSESLIGYIIIGRDEIPGLLPKIAKFKHYREAKKRKLYLKNARKTFSKKKLLECFLKKKVRSVIETPEIFLDITEFLKKNPEPSIFISVDDRQYPNFEKFVKVIDGENVTVVRESGLKKNTSEYRINLVLDTWLNIERMKI